MQSKESMFVVSVSACMPVEDILLIFYSCWICSRGQCPHIKVACCCNPVSSRHLTVLMTSCRSVMMTPLHLLLSLLPCLMVTAGPQPAYDPVLSLLQKYPAYSSYFISRWVTINVCLASCTLFDPT